MFRPFLFLVSIFMSLPMGTLLLVGLLLWVAFYFAARSYLRYVHKPKEKE